MSPPADVSHGVGGLCGQVQLPDGGLGQGAHHITASQHIIHASEKFFVGLIINDFNIVSTTHAPSQGECQLTGNNKG